MISFSEVIWRSETGPLVSEKEYDMKLSGLAQQLVKKHGIRFDPEQVVPADDDLADRVFRAGLELFVESGIYCRDTGRVMQFTEKEVMTAIRHAPSHLVFGQGKDEAKMVYRKMEDPKPPFCMMTPVGTPVSEELFVPLVQSYAQEPLADTFSSAFSQTVNGRPVKSGTPGEVEAAIWNVIRLREAARLAGRPDIGIHNLVSNAERTDATLAAMQPSFGAQPNDGLGIAAIAELKIDYERLKKTAFLRHTPYSKYGLYGPLMGGFAGGPESTAVVYTAYHFLGLIAFEAQWHCGFPLHIHHGCNSMRQLIWLIGVAVQGLSRHTRLMVGVAPFTAAGPCTDMVIFEIAATVTAFTVSGADLDIVAIARNRHPERATGMEARIAAETGHLVARQGIGREQANDMVNRILSLYENRISDAPPGKTFGECYDLEKLKPSEEYENLYEKCRETLYEFGFDYSLW